jgi:hypothetical protein
MKLSELKKIIKEEVEKVLAEAGDVYIAPAELNPAQITALRTLAAKGMLPQLEDAWTEAVEEAASKRKDPSAARFIFQKKVPAAVTATLGPKGPDIVGKLADLFLDKGLKVADLEGVIKASEDVEEIETRDPYADRGGRKLVRRLKSTGETMDL